MGIRVRASRTSLKRISAGGVVLALVALFGLPTAAFAAGATTVSISGTTLTATAAAGEENRITVGSVGPSGSGISIKDTGPVVGGTTLGTGAAAAGCVQATVDEVRCPLGSLTAAVVNTGDLDDLVIVLNDDLTLTANAGDGDDDLRGGPGTDILNGENGDDDVRGGSGADVLNGGSNSPLPTGGDSVDYGSSSTNTQVLLDGAANDGRDVDPVTAGIQPEGDNATNVEIVRGSSHDDVLTGSGADEVLLGNSGNDDLNGAGGNDKLVGGNGADDFDGGTGTDTVDYNPNGADLTITMDNVANDGANGGAEGDNVRNSNEGVLGGVGDDTITGSGNDESLNGGGGSDELHGLGGADDLFGGAGVDTASYEGVTGGTITLDTIANDAGQGDNVQTENVVGGTGVDIITGNTASNRLDGGPGGDTVNGGDGNDTLVLGAGDGADTYIGGAGTDTVTFAGNAIGVNISIGGASVTDGDNIQTSVENLTGGNGNDTLNGGAARNTLTGNEGNDTLNGGDGNDTLKGGLDDDTLNGDEANDLLDGGAGAVTTPVAHTDADVLNGGVGVDSVSYSTRDAGVTVTIGAGANDGEAGEGDNVAAGVEKVTGTSKNDTIVGDATAETLTGGSGNDTINGAGGADKVSGQGGNDILTGGPAGDTLSGGAAADVFHTQDGVKDTINCGDGTDDVSDTDAIDTKTSNCP